MRARGFTSFYTAKFSCGASHAAGVPARASASNSEVLLLDVVNNERESFGFLAVVKDGHGGGALRLSWVSFLVVLAVSEPNTDVVTALNADHWHAVGLGERGDELLVLGIVAVLGEHANEGLLAVEGLADLIESLNETYKEQIRISEA